MGGSCCLWDIPGTPNNQFKMDGNGETTNSYIKITKIWNHPIETAICKWLLRGPGMYVLLCCWRSSSNIDFTFLISIDFCDEAKVEYPFLQKPVISYKQDSTALHMDVDWTLTWWTYKSPCLASSLIFPGVFSVQLDADIQQIFGHCFLLFLFHTWSWWGFKSINQTE